MTSRYQPSDVLILEWRRIVADHTPISASDPCPTCGPVCEPTWRTQRRWAVEMLSLYGNG